MSELTVAMVLFLFPLAYSPGPGNLFFAALGARDGFIATVAANSGYHAATLVVTLAFGFGFATFLAETPQILRMLKWAGGAYILWLAFKIARSSGAGKVHANSAGFVDGVILLALNPKAYVILALLFTQFPGPFAEPGAPAIIWISLVFTLNNLIAFSAYAWLGDRMLRLAANPKTMRNANLAFAATLAAVALWVLLQ